ncbi:unnamed protein product [Haemonchus placei]|uniref:Hydroxysteroid dehydrogenase-like protein 2 n=1 Tax=Haemonchus placei TaxID=6290 RepID=A0A0N4VRW2_HAEPC|nr:unnamed protein product [Haemonchus placei]
MEQNWQYPLNSRGFLSHRSIGQIDPELMPRLRGLTVNNWDGANIVIAAKTATAHPKLPGTIYTAAEEVEKAGGKALACIVDVRDEVSVRQAVESAVKKFGGIDILINNASAISLTNTEDTEMKRYDLMHSINTRGTFLMSKICLPYLKQSKNAHILNISPPLLMEPRWFSNHVAYTMAKYGMSMCVLGMHDEFRSYGVAVNALWPLTGKFQEFGQLK